MSKAAFTVRSKDQETYNMSQNGEAFKLEKKREGKKFQGFLTYFVHKV